MLALDHLVISAASLEAGEEAVSAALGVCLTPGGSHALMSTHNRLLGLGPGLYLEVIAADPGAPPPGRPRWFDLDNFEVKPRLTNWVARCENLKDALAISPPGTGEICGLARGDYRWRISIPADGRLPFDGVFPALIEWQGSLHPADRLPDIGCRLARLTLRHPEADALAALLAGRLDDPRLAIEPADAPGLRAEIDTPHGRGVLT